MRAGKVIRLIPVPLHFTYTFSVVSRTYTYVTSLRRKPDDLGFSWVRLVRN